MKTEMLASMRVFQSFRIVILRSGSNLKAAPRHGTGADEDVKKPKEET
jgi:hypothetical protein